MKLCRVLIVCIAGLTSGLYGAVVGSNTAVSRLGLTTFPQADTNNTMLGFAAFEGGVVLESYTTTCTYDDFFPIGTSANLNGGLVWLARDLVLDESITIPTVGTFASNNRSLLITTTQDLIIPSGNPESTLTLRFITAQPYANTVRSLDWTYDSRFLAVGAETNNLQMYRFNGTTLTLLATQNYAVNVSSVRCHPTKNYVAAGTVANASAPEFFIYRYNETTAALTQVASVEYGADISSIAWHPSGNYVAIARSSPAPEITVYSFVNEVLTQVATGTLAPSSTLIFDVMTWNPTGNYLIVGTFSATTLELFYFNDPTLTLTLTLNIGQQIAACEWSPVDPYIAVGINGSTQRFRMYEHSVAAGTLTEVTSARVGEAVTIQDISWKADGSALTYGTLTSGGSEFFAYTFNRTPRTFSLIQSFEIGAAVNSVSWSPNGAFVAEGDASSRAGVYLGMTTGTNDELILTNLKTTMRSNIIMRKPLRFKGNCVLNGDGNTLILDSGSEIKVDQGSSVLLQNLIIQNVFDSKIRCLDSAGSITLSNSTLLLSDTFTFTQGSFIFANDVVISGTPIFSYQSAQQSTIAPYSTLYFDYGSTFSYAPPSNARNLLAMTDVTSILHLHGTTLRSTTTGMQLTKGTLVVEDICPVVSAATVTAEGVLLGDGTSAGELTIKVLPDSGLDVVSGFLVYNNVS